MNDRLNETRTTYRTGFVRAVIDGAAGILLAFVGFAGISSGLMISAIADRGVIAQLVTDDTLRSRLLRDAELVELVYASLFWGGVGIAAAGGLLLVAAVVFLAVRIRMHRRREFQRSVVADAVIGAAVTLVTSFVPFSPVIGGLISGHLFDQGPWQGIRVGIVVGILVAAPVVVIIGFVSAGFAMSGMLLPSLFLLLVGILSAGFTVVLGAAGGYLGGSIQPH